ncbi:MAG: hypothetical protein L0K86_09100 [Actinomycetia bacterium]|nr:hypothetical protein [Actinomycetes bacterium]
MRVLPTVAATIALTGGMLAATSTSATAAHNTDPARSSNLTRDTPGCVSKREYRRTKRGMRIRVVHKRLYETHGWFIKRNHKRITRRYGFCKRARHQANTKSFAVVYRKFPKRTRVRVTFCGPRRSKSRHCF